MFCRSCGTSNPDDSRFCEACGTPFSKSSSPGSSSGRARSSGDVVELGLGAEIGSFEITDELGIGGMGTVFRARHQRLGHDVAIKVLGSNLARDHELIGRFEQEARLQANLQHPNIVAVYDFIVQGNLCAFVMEFVNGRTLEDVIQLETGPIPLARCLEIFRPVLGALEHAHQRGIVHRDIKPSNIMVTEVGDELVVKVTDFGIAKALGSARRTATGTKMGTLHYMSPEQCRGAKDIDHRADIYSLGATLYEMASAQVPFDIESEYELMTAHIKEQPRRPSELYPGVSPAFESVILQAMSKDRTERYQSADELRAALDGLDDSAPAQPPKHRSSESTHDPTPTLRRSSAVDVVRAEALCGEATILSRRGEHEAALAKAREAHTLSPESKNARDIISVLGGELVEQYCRRARELSKYDIHKALLALKRAVTAAGSCRELMERVRDEKNDVVSSRLSEGDELFRAGAIQNAVEIWEEVAQVLPSDAGTSQRLELARQEIPKLGPVGLKLREGDWHAGAGRFREALRSYTDAQQLGGETSEISHRVVGLSLQIGDGLLRDGKPVEALRAFAKAKETGAEPESLDGRLELALSSATSIFNEREWEGIIRVAVGVGQLASVRSIKSTADDLAERTLLQTANELHNRKDWAAVVELGEKCERIASSERLKELSRDIASRAQGWMEREWWK